MSCSLPNFLSCLQFCYVGLSKIPCIITITKIKAFWQPHLCFNNGPRRCGINGSIGNPTYSKFTHFVLKNVCFKSISYTRSQMIAKEDFEFISRFDGADANTRAGLIQQDPLQLPKTFMNLLSQISKDSTIQYLLTLLDDLLQEDKSRVEIFKNYAAKKNESVWTQLLTMLNRPVGFIMNMTSRVIAKMACWSRELMTGSDLQFYLTWLKDQLKAPNNEYIQSVARCLQMMLRIDQYRISFVALDGITAIVAVLKSKVNFQIQYQLSFCLWVMTFNTSIAERLNK